MRQSVKKKERYPQAKHWFRGLTKPRREREGGPLREMVAYPDGGEGSLGQAMGDGMGAGMEGIMGVAGGPQMAEKAVAGEEVDENVEGRGQPPPEGGKDGAEAEDEEPGMPGRRDLEDDGDARLERRGEDGGRRSGGEGGGAGGLLVGE